MKIRFFVFLLIMGFLPISLFPSDLVIKWQISDSQLQNWLSGKKAVSEDGPVLSFKFICNNSQSLSIEFKDKNYIDLKEIPDGLTPKESEYSIGKKSFYKDIPYQEMLIYPLIKSGGGGCILLTSFTAEVKGVKDIKSSSVDLKSCDISEYSNIFVNYWEGCNFVKESLKENNNTQESLFPTATTPVYRISIKTDGIVRLTKEYLDSISVNLSGADPRNFHIFSRGVEVPIIVEGEGDGVFGSGDAIVFYAQKMAIKDRNIWNGGDFTDTNVYFLYGDNTSGLRMTNVDVTPSNPSFPLITNFNSNLSFETNDYFSWADHLRPNGELWYWSPGLYYYVGGGEKSRQITLNIPHPVINSDNFTITLYEASLNDISNHILEAKINSSSYQTQTFNGKQVATLTYTFSQSLLSPSSILTLRIPSTQTQTDNQILDYLTINYLRTTDSDNNTLLIEDNGGDKKYKCFGFSSNPYIFDLSNFDTSTKIYLPKNLINASFSSGEVTFDYADIGKPRKCYLSSSFLTPDSIEVVQSRDLTQNSLGCDYLIITHPDFHPNGSDAVFQNYISRRSSQFSGGVMYIDVQEIYDNFSNGIFDPTAIKTFLTYAKNNWTRFPSYLLFIGDCSYDYKNYLNDPSFKNWAPTMLIENPSDTSYMGWLVSDAYLADVNGDNYPDLAIGRIPVRTYTELEDILTKIMQYEDGTPLSPWYKNLFFIADTYNQSWEQEFENYSNYLIGNYGVSPYQYEKIFYHDPPYNGTDVDLCASDIRSKWNDGIIVHYMGHSAFRFWGKYDGLLSLSARNGSDLDNLPSVSPPYYQFPFVVNSTCYITTFALQGYDCLFEAILRRLDRGIIGTTGFTTISFNDEDETFTNKFFETLFGNSKERLIGNAVETARFALPSINTRPIQSLVLLGDPTMKIRLPEVPQPISLTATPQNQSALLQWQHPSPPPYGYNIYRSLDGMTFTKITSSPVLYPNNTYTDSSLTNMTTYYYYATSISSEGFESKISNIVSVTPSNPNPPSPPSGLSVVDLAIGDSLKVSWNANSENDLSFYKLYWGVQPSVYTNSQTFSKTTLSTTVSGLTTGTTYYFALTATNTSNKESAFSSEVSGKPTATPIAVRVPQMITDLKLQKNGNDIILSWSKPLFDIKGDPITVTSFDVYRVVNQYDYNLDEVNLSYPNAKISLPAVSGENNYTYTDLGAVSLASTVTYLVVAKDENGNRSPASKNPPQSVLSLKLKRSETNGQTIIFFDPVTMTIDGEPTIVTKYYLYGFYPITSSKDHISPSNTVPPLNPYILYVPLSTCENGGFYCDASTSPPLFYTVVAVDNRGNISLY